MLRPLALFTALLLPAASWSQTVTGAVVGAIVDSSGSPIPGVVLRLTAQATGFTRQVSTDQDGNFFFNAISPGAYNLSVDHAGFKKYEKRNIEVAANDRLSMGEIRLEVGNVSETVTVTAEGSAVQIASGERSGIITSEEVENLTVINRDFATLVSLMPGVVDNPGAEVQGFSGNATFNVLGGRNTSNNITIDGLAAENSNSGNTNTFVSMDSVATVKIMVSNYQAEFGRKPGASIQAVTKSGTRQFHGAAYYYKRHEEFNANNFFNNRLGLPMIPYRFTTAGANLGGPLYLPGLFNGAGSKLFFFISSEEIREARPKSIQQLTTPTTLERNGDFSDSRDVNGALIVVRDPANNKQPFPGNAIPRGLLNPLGQKYLELLPLPNAFNLALTARRYNYQFQESLRIPKRSETARVDYALDRNTTIYGRFGYWWEDQTGSAVAAGNGSWGWLPNHYTNYSKTVVLSLTRILNPSTILEASMGISRWIEAGPPLDQATLDARDRNKTGVAIPQFHPENNPYHLVPEANFGGVNSPANPSYATRFPLRGAETTLIWNAGLTKTTGAHASKIGLYAERWRELKGEQSNFTGTLDFSRDVNNPNDTNSPYANALLGVLKSYSESNSRLPIHGFVTGVEWYAQDNWKAARRLTLDFGVRFGWSQPWHSNRFDEAGFLPWQWDPAQRVRLLEPVRINNTRYGRNPISGELYPAIAISAIAPGAGSPYNGIVNRHDHPEYPQGMRETTGLKTAPRVGFAYDPFGKGKTAIRGGWGLFYEIHERDNFTNGLGYNPPLMVEPIIYYTTLSEFITAPSLSFPTAVTGFDPHRPLPRTMNFSFGIQQDIGFKTLLDVSYVGALARHLTGRTNLNAIPFGSNFKPESLDSTNGNRALPAQFLRPYTGYNDINFYTYFGNSSYHSMQTTLNRRYARGLTYGLAWTWSKAMDYVDGQDNNVSHLVRPQVWNYGRAGWDRTHILKAYWTWETPRLSRHIRGNWVRYALDSWQMSGITTFMSGAPTGIGLSFVNGVDITGSPTDGARVLVVENPMIARSERNFSHNFNTDAFTPPAVGTFGNASKDVVRGPGINNWDISMFKNIPLPIERWRMQFRVESYNTFNHTQYSSFDTGARFDAQGRQVNTRLSEFTAARSPRRLQLALRLTF